jgi:hypothetical protein
LEKGREDQGEIGQGIQIMGHGDNAINQDEN